MQPSVQKLAFDTTQNLNTLHNTSNLTHYTQTHVQSSILDNLYKSHLFRNLQLHLLSEGNVHLQSMSRDEVLRGLITNYSHCLPKPPSNTILTSLPYRSNQDHCMDVIGSTQHLTQVIHLYNITKTYTQIKPNLFILSHKSIIQTLNKYITGDNQHLLLQVHTVQACSFPPVPTPPAQPASPSTHNYRQYVPPHQPLLETGVFEYCIRSSGTIPDQRVHHYLVGRTPFATMSKFPLNHHQDPSTLTNSSTLLLSFAKPQVTKDSPFLNAFIPTQPTTKVTCPNNNSHILLNPNISKLHSHKCVIIMKKYSAKILEINPYSQTWDPNQEPIFRAILQPLHQTSPPRSPLSQQHRLPTLPHLDNDYSQCLLHLSKAGTCVLLICKINIMHIDLVTQFPILTTFYYLPPKQVALKPIFLFQNIPHPNMTLQDPTYRDTPKSSRMPIGRTSLSPRSVHRNTLPGLPNTD